MASASRKACLKQSGKLWDKNAGTDSYGLVTALSNYHLNDHLWKIERTCAHSVSGDVASADERGQVYVYSVNQNVYSAVRLASTPVSAIEFIHCRKSRLIVAYAHGTIAIVDTEAKNVIGHLHLARPAAITRICCHPSKPLATLVADDGTVSIWDLRTLLCTRTLVAQEPLIDVEYNLDGSLLSLVYQTIGAVYYHVADGKPELKCSLPASERQPRWVAYCASGRRDRILLSGDNGLLYIFDGHNGIDISSTQFADRLLYENDDKYVKGVCPLLSVAEVPVQFGNMVYMTTLEDGFSGSGVVATTASSSGLNVVMYSDRGHLLILNISEKRQVKNSCMSQNRGTIPAQWIWRVVTDITPVDNSSKKSTVFSTLTPSLSLGKNASSVMRQSHDLSTLMRTSHSLVGRDRIATIANASYKKGAGPQFLNHVASLPDGDEEKTSSCFMSFVVSDDGSIYAYDWGSILAHDTESRVTGNITGLLLRHRLCGEPSLNTIGSSSQPPPQKESVVKKKSRATASSSHSRNLSPKSKHVSPSRIDENRIANALNMSNNSPVSKHNREKLSRSGSSFTKETTRASASSRRAENNRTARDHADSFDSEAVVSSTSIYELSSFSGQAQLGPKMSKAKLSYFFDKNGKYPDEYRPLIWRFLLQLPENQMAFAELVKRNIHSSFGSRSLSRKYPLESSRLFTKMQALCSQLAHWSEIFGEAPYVPQFCFPFILIFDNDELAALETVMSILMWWGYSWHTCHPNPPAHLTDSFDAILLHYDPALHKHLKSLEISPGLIGWRLTYSMYSEFLSKETWLRVMDFIFTNFESLELMLLVPVALIRLSSASLLCVYSSEHILRYFSAQQDMKAASIVSMVQHMLAKTPKPLLLACYRGAKSKAHDTFKQEISEVEDHKGHKEVAFDSKRGHKGSSHGLPGAKSRLSKKSAVQTSREVGIEEDLAAWRASPAESVRQSLAAEVGSPVFPLPRGRYPAYDGYPKSMVDWELRKRSVQMTLDEELECREDVLRELEKRIAELDNDHEVWMANHKAATENEVKSRYELMEREKEHMRQLAVMEDLISRKRLTALTSLEKVSKQELEMLDEATAETKKMLEAGEQHLRSKMDATIDIQKHRELGQAAEAIITDRMHKLYVDRARDERIKSLSDTLQRAESEMESRTSQMASELQHLEEIAKAKRADRLSRAKESAENETTSRLRSTMLDRLTKLSIEKEDKLLVLERQAVLKTIKEEAKEAEESIRRAQVLYEKQEENVSKEAAAKLALEAFDVSKRKLAEVMDEVRQQSQLLLEEERVALLKEGKSRVRSRDADIATSQIKSLEAQMEDALHAQIEAQNELVRLKELSASSERGGRVSAGRYIQETNVRRGESERRLQEAKVSTGRTSKTAQVLAQKSNESSSDSSSSSSSSEKACHSRSPKKRSFAAVNALLGIDEEALSHRPSTRGKRIDRRAHLDYLDFTDKQDKDQDESSGASDAEKPLPSQSVLSPPGADPDREQSSYESDSDGNLVQSSQFQVRASANGAWTDGVDIQFPASARLKDKITSKSSANAFSSSDDMIQTESSAERFLHGETVTTTTRREVHWKEETQISGSSSEGGPEHRGVGHVDDVLETKWTGFSYTDKRIQSDDSDDDAEYNAMKRLAEKNLDVLGRLRVDDRYGGDTVDQDVRDLLGHQQEYDEREHNSEHSSGLSGDLADGDDNDSALWNFEKYKY